MDSMLSELRIGRDESASQNLACATIRNLEGSDVLRVWVTPYYGLAFYHTYTYTEGRALSALRIVLMASCRS